jgi:transcriptional regulator with XRE-family HTH domain
MESQYLVEFGQTVQLWRQLQDISASRLAARAGISRTTLANIESGTGTTTLANVFAVLNALGIAKQAVHALYPAQTPLGRELIYQKSRNEKNRNKKGRNEESNNG